MRFIKWALALAIALSIPHVLPAQASPYNLFVFPAQSATATGALPTIQLNGLVIPSTIGSSYNSGSVTVVGTGLTTVTFSVYGSFDNGATFYLLPLNILGTPGSTATSITTTVNGVWQFPLTNVTHIYIIPTAFTAASVAFTVNASPNGIIARNGSGGGGAVGSVFGRTGAVVANSGDYSFSQISGNPSAAQILGSDNYDNATVMVNGSGTALVASQKFTQSDACTLSGASAAPYGACSVGSFNSTGDNAVVDPYVAFFTASGSSGKSSEFPYSHLYNDWAVVEQAGGYGNHGMTLYKGGVGDSQTDAVYWGCVSGDYFGSDQGCQDHYDIGGEGPGSTFQVGTYASNILTIVSASCNPNGTGLAYQPCIPSVGNDVIDTQSGGITGHLTGASSAPPSPMSAATWLKQLGTTGASLPTSSVYGYELAANLAPNTTLDNPVNESFRLDNSVGTFSNGDEVCIFGSNFNEESKITTVSGASPTQTLTIPLTRNNVGVAVFKGSCGILAFDADYAMGSDLRTSYKSVSIDGTHAIYNVTAYGNGGFLILPQNGLEPEVVAPVAATTTAYTQGQFVYDGTGVEQVTVSGTSGGTLPTWNNGAISPSNTTVWGSATFINRGSISNFHYFVAAQVAKANNSGTAIAPVWSFTLMPNTLTLAPGDTAESLNMAWQTTQTAYFNQQCLTPGYCDPLVIQVHGMGTGGVPQNSAITIGNDNPMSMYFDAANEATGIVPPDAIGLNLIDPNPGVFENIIASTYAPEEAVWLTYAHLPNQTGYYLFLDNVWGQLYLSNGQFTFENANVFAPSLTANSGYFNNLANGYCVQAGAGGELTTSSSPGPCGFVPNPLVVGGTLSTLPGWMQFARNNGTIYANIALANQYATSPEDAFLCVNAHTDECLQNPGGYLPTGSLGSAYFYGGIYNQMNQLSVARPVPITIPGSAVYTGTAGSTGRQYFYVIMNSHGQEGTPSAPTQVPYQTPVGNTASTLNGSNYVTVQCATPQSNMLSGDGYVVYSLNISGVITRVGACSGTTPLRDTGAGTVVNAVPQFDANATLTAGNIVMAPVDGWLQWPCDIWDGTICGGISQATGTFSFDTGTPGDGLGKIIAAQVNGAAISSSGAATNYLDETGHYSVPSGGGGGGCADSLTAAASGGASPGSSFNCSAALTWDYHTFGAAPAAAGAFDVNSTAFLSTNIGVNFETSTVNAVGLTATPVNGATNVLKIEITGSAFTGTAANLSGTPAVPNGTSGTTQTTSDTTTDLATDAFVHNVFNTFTGITGSLTNNDCILGAGTSSVKNGPCDYGVTVSGIYSFSVPVAATQFIGNGSTQGIDLLGVGTGSIPTTDWPTYYAGFVGPASGTAAYMIQMPLVAPVGGEEMSVATCSTVNSINQCVATWVSPSGGCTDSLTAAATGGASPGSTFNCSAAVTFDYHSFGAAPAAGSSSITTLGTIVTGVWDGTVVAPAYGGTGGDGTGYAYGNGTSAFSYSTTIPFSAISGTVTAADVAGGAANELLYQTGAGATSFLSAVNNAVMSTNGSGVPSESTTLPASLTVPTPSMTPQVVSCATACSPTAAALSNTMVSNYGQAASNIQITGPTLAAGMNFIMIVGTAQASNYWRYTSTTANIYLDGSGTAVTNIIFAAPAVGNSFSCYSFQTGSSTYSLKCTTLAGTSTSS